MKCKKIQFFQLIFSVLQIMQCIVSFHLQLSILKDRKKKKKKKRKKEFKPKGIFPCPFIQTTLVFIWKCKKVLQHLSFFLSFFCVVCPVIIRKNGFAIRRCGALKRNEESEKAAMLRNFENIFIFAICVCTTFSFIFSLNVEPDF